MIKFFKRSKTMLDTFEKMMFAGIGAMSMTREKAEKIFDEYVNKGKEKRENQPKFVQEMLDQAEKTRSEFEEMIDKQIKKTIEKLDLATKEDIKRIENKLDTLLSKE